MKKIITFIFSITAFSVAGQTNLADSTSYSIGVQVGNSLKNNGLSNLNENTIYTAVQDIIQGKTLKISKEKTSEIISKHMSKQNTNLATNRLGGFNHIDSVSYAIGLDIGKNIKDQGLSGLNINFMKLATQDVFQNKKTKIPFEKIGDIINKYIAIVNLPKNNKSKIDGEFFLSQNKTKAGIYTTKSGLQYQILKQSSGAKPIVSDSVKVHYISKLIDGTIVDNSIERNKPAVFAVNKLIAGWVEGLQLIDLFSFDP
jgi:FKBP-type peptidyl-prolyl cis-trans isomerase